MVKVSQLLPAELYRVFPFVLLFIGNVMIFGTRGTVNHEAVIAFNGAVGTMSLLSWLLTWRLWNVSMSGDVVRVSRWYKSIDFGISEIRDIELFPLPVKSGNNYVVKIILDKKKGGYRVFRFIPSRGWGVFDTADEGPAAELLQRWKHMQRGKAQESIRRRGGRKR